MTIGTRDSGLGTREGGLLTSLGAIRILVPALVTFVLCAQTAARVQSPSAAAPQGTATKASDSAAIVRPGIEVFVSDVPPALRGKRVGLITNQSGIDRSRVSDIDLIARHKDLKLVALLAPEHGIRGDVQAGVKVGDETDQKTGVPIYSLYMAEDRGPTPAMLQDVDVLVYDLQEVGGRTWTYVSTMALSMQAAAKKKIPFVVLDRPNPIGGEIVEGAYSTLGSSPSSASTDPRASRHDRRRAGDDVQPEARHRGGADRGARGELAAVAMVRSDRAALDQPVSKPPLAGRVKSYPAR